MRRLQYCVLALVTLAFPWHAWAAGVKLQWTYTQGATPAAVFHVQRQAGCAGVFAQIAEIPVSQVAYTDASLAAGMYCWRVTALSAQGGESTPSNVVAFQVPAGPAAPSSLQGAVIP